LAGVVVWQATLYSGLVVVFDAAICMVSAYIFMYGAPLLVNRSEHFMGRYEQASGESLICLVVALAAAVAGLGNLLILEYSVRNVAGSLLIMALALSGGAGLGASVGVAVGLVSGLTDGNAPLAIALYALAGVLAGVFRNLGKFAVALGFILGSAVTILYFGQARELTLALSEAAISAGIFLLIPARWLVMWQEHWCKTSQPDRWGQSVSEAVAKMNHIAAMFDDLAAAFGQMNAGTRHRIRDDEQARVLSAVGEQVCGDCNNRSDCWERNFYRTYQAMLTMLGQAEVSQLTIGNMQQEVQHHCIRRKELIETINQVAERNRTLSFWQKKITDTREMVSEQMKAAGAILGNLGQEIAKEPHSNQDLALSLTEKAAQLDCPLDSVRVTGTQGTAMIEACKRPCNGMHECMNSILPLVTSMMQEKMTLHAECGNMLRHKKCKLTMQAASRLGVETGLASTAKEAGGVCGDTCGIVPLHKGKVVLLLSDGMGTGNKAAGESVVAVRSLEKLLAVGFSVDLAVKTVNSMLLLRTPDEIFATVDMAIIDMYSGETEFLKIGSAPSFVKRVREVGTIQSSSLPMGILQQIEIEPVKALLVAGDIVVMVSDGIADVPNRGSDKESWVVNFLRRTATVSPQELADKILEQALALSGGRAHDDMTVLVAKIVEQPFKVQQH
jgi:stage II sporulation protein E